MNKKEENEFFYIIFETIIDIFSAFGVVYAIQDGCRICWIITFVVLLNIMSKVMADIFLSVGTIIEESVDKRES